MFVHFTFQHDWQIYDITDREIRYQKNTAKKIDYKKIQGTFHSDKKIPF